MKHVKNYDEKKEREKWLHDAHMANRRVSRS